ncbi:hypothetical protein PF010_g6705 [Phytophthora fragariae]|nr:hypothetical protein PF010_g6705 [Phytophthora fragariae]
MLILNYDGETVALGGEFMHMDIQFEFKIIAQKELHVAKVHLKGTICNPAVAHRMALLLIEHGERAALAENKQEDGRIPCCVSDTHTAHFEVRPRPSVWNFRLKMHGCPVCHRIYAGLDGQARHACRATIGQQQLERCQRFIAGGEASMRRHQATLRCTRLGGDGYVQEAALRRISNAAAQRTHRAVQVDLLRADVEAARLRQDAANAIALASALSQAADILEAVALPAEDRPGEASVQPAPQDSRVESTVDIESAVDSNPTEMDGSAPTSTVDLETVDAGASKSQEDGIENLTAEESTCDICVEDIPPDELLGCHAGVPQCSVMMCAMCTQCSLEEHSRCPLCRNSAEAPPRDHAEQLDPQCQECDRPASSDDRAVGYACKNAYHPERLAQLVSTGKHVPLIVTIDGVNGAPCPSFDAADRVLKLAPEIVQALAEEQGV